MTNKNYRKTLLKGIQKLQQTGIELSGGNCGMTALALQKWLKETTGKDLEIGLITNVETEEELYEEPDIYHVFLVDDNILWDENGKNSVEDIFQIAIDQYDNHDPIDFIFDSSELDKVENIIRLETNWDTTWKEFYGILKG